MPDGTSDIPVAFVDWSAPELPPSAAVTAEMLLGAAARMEAVLAQLDRALLELHPQAAIRRIGEARMQAQIGLRLVELARKAVAP